MPIVSTVFHETVAAKAALPLDVLDDNGVDDDCMLSSIFVDLGWVFIGFALIRCGFFSWLVPNSILEKMCRWYSNTMRISSTCKGCFPSDSCALSETTKSSSKLFQSVPVIRKKEALSNDELLKVYARTGDPRSCALFNEMVESGTMFSEGLCGVLLSRCAESKCLSLANAVSDYLRARSMATLATHKALMKVYACCGLFSEACDVYEKVKEDGFQPDATMHSCFMKLAAKCGRSDLCHLIDDVCPQGNAHKYMCLIRAAGRDGNAPKALELMRELGASQPGGIHVMAYNCVLDVCVTHGDMSVALNLVHEMERVSAPNSVTYNTLAKGYCARGQLASARRVICQMEQKRLTPDSASYNCLLGGALSMLDFAEAWAIVEEMESRGIKFDFYTKSIMMTAAKKARHPRDAERALSLLDHSDVVPHEDEVFFNTAVDACTCRRDTVRLAKIIDDFQSARLTNCAGKALPSSLIAPSVHTFGLLIKACGQMARICSCKSFWHEMVHERGLVPNEITLCCMMDALVCAGNVKEAMQLFRKWQERVPGNTVIYSTLIKGFANIGDACNAMLLFKELRERGVGVNHITYTTIIDAQARAGDMDMAKNLLQQMEHDGCVPNTITFSTIVKGYCEHGDLSSAFAVFREMLNRDLEADVVIYNTLLDGCIRHDYFDMADQLLNSMKDFGVRASNSTLSVVVRMWGKRRQLDRAVKAVQTMPREHGFCVDARVCTSLLSACVQNGALDRAIKTFALMKTWPTWSGPDAGTYNVLVHGLLRLGRSRHDLRVAANILEEACGLSQARFGTARRSGARQNTKMTLDVGKIRQLFRAIQRDSVLAQELCPRLSEKLCAAGIHVSMSNIVLTPATT
eukprot:TRINITY_DN43443_c0_g1_i1.p1 TRINITY_DN43443_c0_g1~~TRINITY_DN43443_c0_g1_i1.p1  ORF type:complete len:861 (+),score=125.95 TRINITY_DN43443_c0_g1_i1:241-2823(+)